MKAQCPECDTDIELKTATELGEAVTCPECGALLEVISLKPLELDYTLDIEDEEEDDDFDFEDDDWDEDDDELWDEDEEEEEDDF